MTTANRATGTGNRPGAAPGSAPNTAPAAGFDSGFEADFDAGFDDSFDDSFDDAVAGRAADNRQGMVRAAETRLMALAEDGKAELVRSFDALVLLAHDFAARLDASNIGPAGSYVRTAAGMLTELQTTLRERPVQHLLDDGRELVRRQPRVALGVAMAAGFIAARLAKAGMPRS